MVFIPKSIKTNFANRISCQGTKHSYTYKIDVKFSAINLAETKNHADVDKLKSQYHSWLLETHQEEKAAEIKEMEGDKRSALQLYIKAGLVSRAAK